MAVMIPALAQQTYTDEELLNLSMDELMDIDIVSVSKLNLNNVSEVPSAVTIVSAEEIRNSGAKNMEEVMSMVAGFDVIRNSFSPNTSFGVRGLFGTTGTNNKILFLINDHPIQSIFAGDASVFIANMPLQNISQIEIVRGPGSTLFGAGAFLAVINIRTKDADNNAEVSAAMGSFGQINTSGIYTFKRGDNVKLTVSGDYYQTDGPDITMESDLARELLDPFGQGLLNYQGPTTSGTPGNLNLNRASYNLNLNAQIHDFYVNGGIMSSEDRPPIGSYESLVENSDIQNNAYYLESGYRSRLMNEQGEILFKGYYDQYTTDSQTDIWAKEASPLFNYFSFVRYLIDSTIIGNTANLYDTEEALYYHTKAKHEKVGGEINFAYNFGNYVNVLSGFMLEKHSLFDAETYANGNIFIDFDKIMSFQDDFFLSLEAFDGERDLSANFNWIQENQRTVSAIFAQADVNLKNVLGAYSLQHFKIVLGARYDNYSDAGGSLNPRLALLFAPVPKLYFKALYGEAFRAPSFAELYQQNNSIFLGNPDLKAENVRTMEAIFGYQLKDKLHATLTYFNTRIDDNIQLVDDGDPTTLAASRYTNVGDIRTNGLEAEIRYSFLGNGYLKGSMTLQNVLDVTKNEFTAMNFMTGEQFSDVQENFNPGRIPNVILNLTANYPVTKNINLNVTSNYLGERSRSEALAFELDPQRLPTGNVVRGDNRDAIPSRIIVNASLTLHSFDFVPGMQLQFTGYNLLDEENLNPTLNISNDLPRAGVNWMGRLSYKF